MSCGGHNSTAHAASLCCRFVSRIFVVPDHPELLLSSSGVSATRRPPLWFLGGEGVTEQELVLCSLSGLEASAAFPLLAVH